MNIHTCHRNIIFNIFAFIEGGDLYQVCGTCRRLWQMYKCPELYRYLIRKRYSDLICENMDINHYFKLEISGYLYVLTFKDKIVVKLIDKYITDVKLYSNQILYLNFKSELKIWDQSSMTIDDNVQKLYNKNLFGKDNFVFAVSCGPDILKIQRIEIPRGQIKYIDHFISGRRIDTLIDNDVYSTHRFVDKILPSLLSGSGHQDGLFIHVAGNIKYMNSCRGRYALIDMDDNLYIDFIYTFQLIARNVKKVVLGSDFYYVVYMTMDNTVHVYDKYENNIILCHKAKDIAVCCSFICIIDDKDELFIFNDKQDIITRIKNIKHVCCKKNKVVLIAKTIIGEC